MGSCDITRAFNTKIASKMVRGSGWERHWLAAKISALVT